MSRSPVVTQNPKPKTQNRKGLIPLLDLLILKEVIGPWVFGVGMFTSLLMAGTFLGRLTEYLSEGVPPLTVVKVFFLLMPAILAKTFPMAMLLAALLSYGRLSGDSEITAVRAAGGSLYRVVRPATIFALGVALLAFGFNEIVVPSATRESLALANEIVKLKNPNEAFPVVKEFTEKGILRLGVVAQNFVPTSQTFEGVVLVPFDETGKLVGYFRAKEMIFRGEKDWRLRGGTTFVAPDGTGHYTSEGEVWPDEAIQIPQTPTDLIKPRDDDFDAQSMAELGRNIAVYKRDKTKTRAAIANYEYGFWNKISLPLAAVVFGTLGSVLGIRNARTGTATGFALAVAIIFGYVTVTNFMNVWARNGVLPPWVASFTPIVLGLGASCLIMVRKNS
ncbi:YjgP/YjgQ family permease [bacterium]|nr:MAG: YjgP/YjgQ family permease [bacterium]